MMQRSPIITLTRKELKTMLQAAVQEQVEADQKVLDDALAEQVEKDAVADFQYFYAGALLILHDVFGYGNLRLNRFFDSLEKLMARHYSPEALTEILKARTGIELGVGGTVEADRNG